MKQIVTLLTLCAGAAMPFAASAEQITSVEKLSNTATYTITRRASSGSGIIAPTTDGTVQSGASASDASVWSIHYSSVEKAYYLYNVKEGKFVGNTDGKATLTDTPVDLAPLYVDHISRWLLDCGGSLLGFASTSGEGIFIESYTQKTSDAAGIFFEIATASRTLTTAESDAIEAKIKAGRPAVLSKYTDFITKAKQQAADGLTNYAGAYDVAELEAMSKNPDKYSLNEFDAAYRKALASRLPQPGRYYVLRNTQRPTSYAGNLMSVKTNGELNQHAQQTWVVSSGSADYTDGLSVFAFEPQGPDCSMSHLFYPATGQYLVSNGNSSAKLWLGAKNTATTFTIEPRGEFNRAFRFALPSDKGWITVDPSGNVVSYGVAENPNYFYFEQVTSVTATPTSAGLKPLTLPFPVEIPDGCEALYAAEIANGKVYMEKFDGIVPAMMPFVLYSSNGNKAVTLNVADTNPKFNSDNIMQGSAIRVDAPAAYHIMATNADGELYFRRMPPKASTTFSANTAFLVTDAETDLPITFETRPNAHISEITADELDAEAKWYD
ncbi:MAG: hypothetical protein K2M97_04495, partial [Muribaculaceae bacterium]|nr:hypothetical protein [Muribaculaceae bacterium]